MPSLNLREYLGLGALGVGLVTLGVGGCIALQSGSKRPPLAPQSSPAALEFAAGGGTAAAPPPGAAPETGNVAAPATGPASPVVMVHVVGAVRSPGVYRLRPGDRINDAVRAAGGFLPNAQQDALNLADVVYDADQIYIPRHEEYAAAVAAGNNRKGAKASAHGLSVPRPRQQFIVRGIAPRLSPVTIPAPSRAVATPAPVLPMPVVFNAPPPPAPSAPALALDTSTSSSTVPAKLLTPHKGRILGRLTGSDADGGTAGNRGDGAAATTEDPGAGTATDRGDVLPLPATVAAAAAEGDPEPIPKRAPSRSTRGEVTEHASHTQKLKNPGDGIVHLNSATAEELEKLPGIGQATATKIIEYRATLGHFSSIRQLMGIRGMGDKKLAKIAPFLAL